MEALTFESISDSQDLKDVEETLRLNDDIVVRKFKGGVIDIYDYTDDTGVVLRPEEAQKLRLLIEGI